MLYVPRIVFHFEFQSCGVFQSVLRKIFVNRIVRIVQLNCHLTERAEDGNRSDQSVLTISDHIINSNERIMLARLDDFQF